MQMNKRKSLKNQAETDNPVVWSFRGNSNKYGLLLFYPTYTILATSVCWVQNQANMMMLLFFW